MVDIRSDVAPDVVSGVGSDPAPNGAPDGTSDVVYPQHWESDVVLADGGTVHLRPVRPDDGDKLQDLYSRLSEESLYLRFFSPVPAPTARQLEQISEIDYVRRFSLVAELGNDIVAIARYDRTGADEGGAAEVAFSVQDDQHGRGLGSILLEHLAAVARDAGIRRFEAWTMPSNHKMLRVFSEAGFVVSRRFDAGTVEVSFDIEQTPESVAVQRDREHTSEARSMGRMLAPRTIAVVGAGRRRATIGHEVLRNLLVAGFTGPVYPVHPTATSVAGVRAFPTVADIPDRIDLAVVAVPAAAVPEVVEDCSRAGVQGMVIISAGFAEVGGENAHVEHDIVSVARRNGMRMIGPNCMGIVNTNPDVAMNATFAPFPPVRGRVGFSSQSGGLGIELLARAGLLGLGVSTFVSMGNKADVSGNDLLQYWEEDPDTDVILLYLESFGNPRKFARIARRVSRKKPIIAVKSGRTTAGTRGASSHTAALASPDVAVDALFHQAGVIRVDTLEELFDTAIILAHQPLPPGRRVGIISNGGGPAILAADACEAVGLEVPELSPVTQAELRSFVSADASVRNPVDLVASASAETYERAMRTLLADPGIDALIPMFVPPLVTRAEDVAAAVVAAAADAQAKPVVACFLGRNGTLDLLPGTSAPARAIPSFAFPEGAAAALDRAARYAEWRAAPEGVVPELTGVDEPGARALVEDRLARTPDGEWLDPELATRLCGCFGVRVVQTVAAADAEAAALAATTIGFPVVLKAGSGRIVHKSDVGAVRLGLASAGEVRDAFTDMATRLGADMGGAVVQPMAASGVETIVGVTRDPSFGSLVMFGIGGFAAELTRDTALRILPLTDLDAHELVRTLRSSPLLFGYRGSPLADVDALEDLLLRVGRLAEVVPEIAEMDCNPVVVSASGALALDVKIRLAPPAPGPPPGVRRMRPV
jgi:acetyl coenzyme A synthetase (ADP forming)-like protein